MLWLAGGMSTEALIQTILNSVGYIIGTSKIGKLGDALLILLSKGASAYAGNWYDLAWTVVDVVLAFTPYYKVSAVIYAIMKLGPAL